MPVHGHMISSSDEAIDESDNELPMIKEEDEDMYFEELWEKTWNSPLMEEKQSEIKPLPTLETSTYISQKLWKLKEDPIFETPMIVRTLTPSASGKSISRAFLVKGNEVKDLD